MEKITNICSFLERRSLTRKAGLSLRKGWTTILKKLAKEQEEKSCSTESASLDQFDDRQIVIINNIDPNPPAGDDIRTITLYGDVTEKACGDTVSALTYLSDTSKGMVLKDPDNLENPEYETISKPIKMIISTMGGSAADMFAVYDTMTMIKDNCDIETVGVGKVMSAGVLLLAAGTKGKRKIGKNCRVMIHGMRAGFGGSLNSMENEIEEIKWMQETYVKCLADETNMSVKHIKKLITKQVDVYLSAKEALKAGIVDEIV